MQADSQVIRRSLTTTENEQAVLVARKRLDNSNRCKICSDCGQVAADWCVHPNYLLLDSKTCVVRAATTTEILREGRPTFFLTRDVEVRVVPVGGLSPGESPDLHGDGAKATERHSAVRSFYCLTTVPPPFASANLWRWCSRHLAPIGAACPPGQAESCNERYSWRGAKDGGLAIAAERFALLCSATLQHLLVS
jgi:hypothetical protein